MRQLSLVQTLDHIRDSISAFNKEARNDAETARKLLRMTTYWVYDQLSNEFGPSKFVGFVGLTLGDYRSAQTESPDLFNGGLTRKRIERVLGVDYSKDPDRSIELIAWGETLIA